MVNMNERTTFAGLGSDQCLSLDEIRDIEEAEKALFENTARNVESVIVNARNSACESGLDPDLAQRGLITTLIVTTASFVALYNNSPEREPLAFFAVMRCMAEALMDVSA